jgi:hypothetical protein
MTTAYSLRISLDPCRFLRHDQHQRLAISFEFAFKFTHADSFFATHFGTQSTTHYVAYHSAFSITHHDT